jgi:hypothetical protein
MIKYIYYSDRLIGIEFFMYKKIYSLKSILIIVCFFVFLAGIMAFMVKLLINTIYTKM